MVPDRIEREVLIEAPVDVVWSIVTEAEHVGTWFSDSAEIDLHPGGKTVLTWDEYGTFPGRIREFEPPRFISFRWARPAGAEPVEGGLHARRVHPQPRGRRHATAGGRERVQRARRHRRGEGGIPGRKHPGLEGGLVSSRNTCRSTSEHRLDDETTGRRGGELWAAVAEPTRRRLLDVLLARGEATATTLANELPVTRQAVAKHLAVLDRAGLVERQQRGREVHYAVRPERLDAAAEAMARVATEWDQRLAEIERLAESRQSGS